GRYRSCLFSGHDTPPAQLTLPLPSVYHLHSQFATLEKMSDSVADRPFLCWPKALRKVRAWLEPWTLLQRYWRAWSAQPPPLALQQLLDALALGVPLF